MIRLCVLLVTVELAALPACGWAGTTGSDEVDYGLVITGGELLNGVRADAHTPFLTRTLRPLGMHCLQSSIVEDQVDDIREAVERLQKKVRLVIVTGGLGPTQNDITREALVAATGIGLSEHAGALADLAARLKTPAGELRANLRRQVQVPQQGTYLKNRQGTAVGLVFEGLRGTVVALPGPPRELQPMVRDELVPYLSRRFGLHLPGATLHLRFVGVGQSQIDHVLKEHTNPPDDLMVSSEFEGSRVDFTFALPGRRPEDQKRLDAFRAQIVKELGASIYAEDESTLEECVGRLLEKNGIHLATAEVGSGGALAAGLSGTGTASRYFRGGVVAADEEHLRRLIEVPAGAGGERPSAAQRAERLAEAVARHLEADSGVAVGAVQSDPQGARFVAVALRLAGRPNVDVRLALRGGGEIARTQLATQLLDLLRRQL